MSDPLKPSVGVLVKLGSIIVHMEEAMSDKAHRFDISALESCLNDPEVKEWVKAMDAMAFLPLKR